MERPTSHHRSTGTLSLTLALILLATGGLCCAAWGALMTRWAQAGDATTAGVTWFDYAGLFLGTFVAGGIGCLMASNLWQLYLRNRYREKAMRQHPDAPWRWRTDWVRERISSDTLRGLLLLGAVTLLWNMLALPLCYLLGQAITGAGQWSALLGLTVPGLGGVLIFWWLRMAIHWWAFRSTNLVLDTLPGVSGGPLRGRIRTSMDTLPAEGFQVTLACLKTVRDARRLRPPTASVAWQETRFIRVDPSDGAVPILFAIPFDAPPSSMESAEIQWRLEIRAFIRGLNYCARFEIPVYRTAESSPNYEPDETEIRPFLKVPDQKVRLAIRGIRANIHPDGTREFHFPMARHRLRGLVAIFLLHLWPLVTIAFCLFASPPWPLLILLLLSNGIVVYATLDLWFYQSRIEASPGQLRVSWGLIKDRHHRVFPLPDIASLTCERRRLSLISPGFAIRLTTRAGRRVTLAKRLPDESLAESIRSQLRKQLLTPPSEPQATHS